MPRTLRITLTTDGSSDKALLPVIRWMVLQTFPGRTLEYDLQWADLGRVVGKDIRKPRVEQAIHYYPCDLLLFHRDAESRDPPLIEERYREIETELRGHTIPAVPIVPITMTEAWLLIEESAIKKAADNPNSSAKLTLPAIDRLEQLPDPKQTLHELLIAACELPARRLDKFKRPSELTRRRERVAELIDDFSPLRQLSAFQRFEQNWNTAMANFADYVE
jgi:hypothetical protein